MIQALISREGAWVGGTVVVVAVALFYAVHGASNPADAWWTGIVSNLPTSLFAVIVGIPIALRIAQISERRAEAKERNFARQRREEVLKLLRDDLLANRDRIKKRLRPDPKVAMNPPTIFVPELPWIDADLWTALSSGGELKWIDDPSLIQGCAVAYGDIRLVGDLERLYYETIMFPGVRTANPHEQIAAHLLILGQNAIRCSEVALDALRRSLGVHGAAAVP